jgi:kynurenine formamidase
VRINHSIQGIGGWADLLCPIDISLSMGPGGDNPRAFFIDPAKFDAIRVGDFVGRVSEGGSANCEILTLCAHGNVTHTECVGHITEERIVLPDVLKQFWFSAQLVSIDISSRGCISLADIESLQMGEIESVIFRSLPNRNEKKHMDWSGNSAPYFEPEALAYLRDLRVVHMLTDFPSVDPEEDDGRLAAHHEWWGLPQRSQVGNTVKMDEGHPRFSSTITELIFVPDWVEDGIYMLNFQVPNLMTDAVPSRPVIYKWNALVHTIANAKIS